MFERIPIAKHVFKKGLLLKNLYSVGIFQNFTNVLLKYKSGAFSIQPPVTKADSLSWT